MGRKVILRCFSPFEFKIRKQCPPISNDVFGFCSSLSEDLEKLVQSLEENSASFKWSVEAMNLLKTMQIGLLFLIEKLNLPISLEGEKWLDQYMDQTIMLLDFCNLLKSAISRLQRFQMIAELTVRNLCDASSNTCNLNKEIQRLETERKKLLGGDKLKDGRLKNQVGEIDLIHKSSLKWNGFGDAIFAVRNTTALLSLLLVSVIVSPALIIDMGKQENHESPLLEWSTSVYALFSGFNERFQKKPRKNSSLILVELEMIERVVVDMKGQVSEEGEIKDWERFSRSIELLSENSNNLKKGLEMFDSVVNEVFEEVIKARDKLLKIFSGNVIYVN